MEKILGVVLCGGESIRMGTDKGLKPIENTIWSKWVADKLKFLHCPVVWSINATQIAMYKEHFSPESLIIDDNDMKGPMRGLFSVHNKYPDKNLLVLACDMLEQDAFTISHLLQVFHEEGGYDFYVYQDKEFDQPFCGIYTGKALHALEQYVQTHGMADSSMQWLLRKGNTRRIPINHEGAFENSNTINKKND